MFHPAGAQLLRDPLSQRVRAPNFPHPEPDFSADDAFLSSSNVDLSYVLQTWSVSANNGAVHLLSLP